MPLVENVAGEVVRIIHVETALQKCRMVHSQTNFQNEADTKDLLDCLSDVMGGPPFQRKPTNSM